MQSAPGPPGAPHPPPSPAPRRADPAPAWLSRAAGAVAAAAPPWSILWGILVYASYLMHWSPALTWAALALACLPFPARYLSGQAMVSRTPFDIPAALLVLGAFVGLCVSPERTMSLGAFQCLLATLIACCVLTSDSRPAFWMKVLVVLLVAGLAIVLLLILTGNPHVYNQWGPESASKDTNHGMAMMLAVAAAILFGVACFGTRGRTRVLMALVSAATVIVVLAITKDSLLSLVSGQSISGQDGNSGRLELWRDTVDLLSASPVAGAPWTGLGLGCWARAYYGRMDLWNAPDFWEVSHPHNAYLELYCDTGVLGALALALALVIGARLSIGIITSPRSHPAYGLGIGVVLACIATLAVGLLESAPVGAPHLAAATYYYVISPIPFALAAFLVVAHHLITRGQTG